MTSIQYSKIYSHFYTKASAYDFLDLDELEINEFLCTWLHSAIAKPYVRRLFSTLTLDDEIQTLSYEMKYALTEDEDMEFIYDVLSTGLIFEWLSPKINNITSIAQMFGSKEEKFYSEANHLKELKDLKATIQKEQRSLIRDRGYINNSYLDGAS